MSEIIYLNEKQTKGIAFVDKFGGRQMKIKASKFTGCANCIFTVLDKEFNKDICGLTRNRYCFSLERRDKIPIIWVEDKGEETNKNNKTMEEKKDNVTLFREITQKMAETYAKKNTDYGDSFGKSLDEFGLVAGIVRMSDKFNRIKNLIKQSNAPENCGIETTPQVRDESIKDTLLDLACYSVMALVWLEKKG